MRFFRRGPVSRSVSPNTRTISSDPAAPFSPSTARPKTRTAPAPGYFSKPFNLERIIYLGNEPNESARDHLRQSIVESQDVLKSQIKAIHGAFEQAVLSYREIDELIPEDKSGPVAKQKA
jgi:hypothetical protein